MQNGHHLGIKLLTNNIAYPDIKRYSAVILFYAKCNKKHIWYHIWARYK